MTANRNNEIQLCNNCKHFKVEQTGYDEYPANTAIGYCNKFYFENANPAEDIPTFDCKDYSQLKGE